MLCAPVHAQEAKKGKPAPEAYAGIIVKYKSSTAARATVTSATAMRAMEERARVKIAASRHGAMGIAVYRFEQAMPAAEARAAAARVAMDPSVEYAVPDQVMYALQTAPNDTAYAGRQWTLQAPPSAVGGANLPLAWQRTTGSSSVVVAVVDSRVRPGHPDLAGRLLPGYDFISGDAFAALNFPPNWNAADGNGRDADPTDPGDYLDDTLLAQLPPGHGLRTGPSSWHGTHVAGTGVIDSGKPLEVEVVSVGSDGKPWNQPVQDPGAAPGKLGIGAGSGSRQFRALPQQSHHDERLGEGD